MSAERANVAAIVRASAGPELLERLLHLDAVRANGALPKDEALAPPDRDASIDTDVVMAGGGLSLLIAATLADLGVRVVVVERARAGVAHREWNASGPELDALVRGGLFTSGEIDSLIVAKYTHGVCQFHGGALRPVRGVLDHAVDAGPLLARTRAIAEARGVRFIDDATVIGVGSGSHAVRVRARARDGRSREIVARVLVDARGASSPYATADLACPTVGGVVRGLAEGGGPKEIDPKVGEILVTNEPAVDGRQHLWEAFPGRAGETTIYAFYYARAREAGSLVDLYARFFATLGDYKRGDAKLARPTFGVIPGWSRLTPAPRAPAGRIVLVGDAASRHSPLTFCGFGSMLRSFFAAAHAIADAIHAGKMPKTRDGALAHDAPVHSLTGALAALMASSRMEGNAMNVLLDAAFGALADLGNADYAALLRDEMSARRFASFLRLTAQRHPAAYGEAFRALGARALGLWGWHAAREVALAR